MMTLKVNGRDHEIDADPDTPLLYVLRDDLELNARQVWLWPRAMRRMHGHR